MECAWKVKFPLGFNPDLKYMDHLVQPLRVVHKPLFAGIILELAVTASHVILSRLGFRRYSCQGFHYWTRGVKDPPPGACHADSFQQIMAADCADIIRGGSLEEACVERLERPFDAAIAQCGSSPGAAAFAKVPGLDVDENGNARAYAHTDSCVPDGRRDDMDDMGVSACIAQSLSSASYYSQHTAASDSVGFASYDSKRCTISDVTSGVTSSLHRNGASEAVERNDLTAAGNKATQAACDRLCENQQPQSIQRPCNLVGSAAEAANCKLDTADSTDSRFPNPGACDDVRLQAHSHEAGMQCQPPLENARVVDLASGVVRVESLATPGGCSAAQAPVAPLPVCFLHGVGLGILPYLQLLTKLMTALPDRPFILLEVRL